MTADPATDRSVLNQRALDQIRMLEEPGEPSLLVEMVNAFRAALVMYIGHLRTALTTGDAEAVASAAHALKGAAGSIGADGVQALALRMETDGRHHSLAAGPEQIAALEHAGDQALTALAHELARAA